MISRAVWIAEVIALSLSRVVRRELPDLLTGSLGKNLHALLVRLVLGFPGGKRGRRESAAPQFGSDAAQSGISS